MTNGIEKKKLPWGMIALTISVVVMVQLMLLLAVGSYIKRGTDRTTKAQVTAVRKATAEQTQTNYNNALHFCVTANDRITGDNRRTAQTRRLRNVVRAFARDAKDARLADNDINVATQFRNYELEAESLDYPYTPHISCLKTIAQPPGAEFGLVPPDIRIRAVQITQESSPVPNAPVP